ncbi:MAG: hypothetical protein U5L01_04650 [Rheinheimera sp.]|nr:hypothetical protein [Rheinheimera sp.]
MQANNRGVPVVEGGPDAYFCQLPLKSMLKALHQHAIPAAISYTAGTYVCNSTFYHLCHLRKKMHLPVGFIHIPYALVKHPAYACLWPDLALTAVNCIQVALTSNNDDSYQTGTLD